MYAPCECLLVIVTNKLELNAERMKTPLYGRVDAFFSLFKSPRVRVIGFRSGPYPKPGSCVGEDVHLLTRRCASGRCHAER